MAQSGHQLARRRGGAAACSAHPLGGPRLTCSPSPAHQQLPGQMETLGPLATTSLADQGVENGAGHTWKLFSQNKGS